MLVKFKEKQENNTGYIVFSVYQRTEPKEINLANHKVITKDLHDNDISYQELEGSYNGIIERSFIVPNNSQTRQLLKHVFTVYEQECYMRLEAHKHGLYKATFVDREGNEEFQGYLRELPKATIDALKLDYSYFRGDMAKHWTIWPTDTTQMEAFAKEVAAYA